MYGKACMRFAMTTPAVHAAMTLFMVLSPCICRGELQWRQTTVRRDVGLADKEVIGSAEFTSENATTITAVRASCGCIDATTDKLSYACGERGRLTYRIATGEDVGTVARTIVVTANDGTEQVTVLRFQLAVPSPVKTSCSEIQWIVGRQASAKTIEIESVVERPVEITEVKCAHSAIRCRFEPLRAGSYRITVEPLDVQGSFETALRIRLRIGAGTEALYRTLLVPVRASYEF